MPCAMSSVELHTVDRIERGSMDQLRQRRRSDYTGVRCNFEPPVCAWTVKKFTTPRTARFVRPTALPLSLAGYPLRNAGPLRARRPRLLRRRCISSCLHPLPTDRGPDAF